MAKQHAFTKVAIDAASLLGVPLFTAQGRELAALARREREVLALLPSRVRRASAPVHDDF